MLFDLKGKRRHVVQGTYVLLAVLMGGGLILFGIGGGTSGGLLDAFKGGGGSSGNSLVQKRIDAANKRLAVNPQDRGALQELIRDNYQLASISADPTTGAFTADGKKDLQRAATAWERYLNTNPPKPDPALASYMTQAYVGLGNFSQAEKAALVVAAAQPTSAAYLRVVAYAAQVKPPDVRTLDLAGQKALQLSPKGQRSSVRKQIQQLRAAAGVTSAKTGTTGTTGKSGTSGK